MTLTAETKKWLVENCDVKDSASDNDYRDALGKALATGILSTEKFAELQTDPQAEEAKAFDAKLSMIADNIKSLSDIMAAQQVEKAVEPEVAEVVEEKAAPAETKATKDDILNLEKKLGELAQAAEEKATEVRVKGANEMYSDTKSGLTYPSQTKTGKAHPMAGQPVLDASKNGRAMHTTSDLDAAVAGAWWKFKLAQHQNGKSARFGFEALNQHDQELLNFAGDNMEWDASDEKSPNKVSRGLPGGFKANLIDDSTSGGTEAAPIVFDDMVIQTPLLHGELFPQVFQAPLERGRRVEGVSIGQVTGAWGGVDDSSIALFDSTSYVSAFDTTIHRWQCAVRVGLDFLSDTPIDFASVITTQIGEQLLNDLDDVIASGNGTTQPEGVINKSGVTSVNFGGTTTLSNYESLRFGVAKPEHRGVGNSAVFCGTETSYQRMKALPVGASDARRLHGNDYSDNYSWMGVPYKINDSLSNQQVFYAILRRYRMYRRKGLEVMESRDGDTLMRANSLLITAQARWGGQLERGGVAAITTTAPS